MNNIDTIGFNGNNNYSHGELDQSVTVINSLLHKCEKSQLKLIPGTSQYTLLTNRIKALRISQDLIQQSINQHNSQSAN